MRKAIRIWDGCKVLGIIEVDQHGGSSWTSRAGGAANSSNPDIEIDPFVGYIVNHSAEYGGVVDFNKTEEDDG